MKYRLYFITQDKAGNGIRLSSWEAGLETIGLEQVTYINNVILV